MKYRKGKKSFRRGKRRRGGRKSKAIKSYNVSRGGIRL